jgi:hypothetical protein
MLLHETDRLLIGPLTPDIMATFHITMTQMGAVSTGALKLGAYRWGSVRPLLAPETALAGVVHLGVHDLDQRSGTLLPGLSGNPCVHRHRRLELSGAL